MAPRTDPHFVVEGLAEDFGGLPWVVARRLDDHYLLIRFGALLNGVPIANADLVAPLDGAERGKDDVWGFSLNHIDDLKSFTVGQTVALRHSILLVVE
jgi:hypothetical protein